MNWQNTSALSTSWSHWTIYSYHSPYCYLFYNILVTEIMTKHKLIDSSWTNRHKKYNVQFSKGYSGLYMMHLSLKKQININLRNTKHWFFWIVTCYYLSKYEQNIKKVIRKCWSKINYDITKMSDFSRLPITIA